VVAGVVATWTGNGWHAFRDSGNVDARVDLSKCGSHPVKDPAGPKFPSTTNNIARPLRLFSPKAVLECFAGGDDLMLINC